MCGIAFIYNPNLAQPELDSRMQYCLKQLVHRGPDEYGIHGGHSWTAGHRRLSIIDIATSHQPMRDPSGNYTLVYNGEIYNYQDLRKQLQGQWNFKTQGDTEIILAGLCLHGESFISKLQGMWAIAFWDNNNNCLLLSRDRLGKKPLYFYENSGSIACCSELPALHYLLDNRPEEDLDSSADYFRYGFYLPGYTAYKNIREVLPGHNIVYNPGSAIVQTNYWKLKTGNYSGTKQEAEENLRTTFISAVQKRMIADVEIGAFLSGGIDSSLIVATMVKELGLKPKTFTIGFDNSSYDERKYAEQVSKQYNTEHFEQMMVNFNVEELIKLVIEHHGQPFGDASLLPTAMVAKLAAQHVKVVLSGDGGDELFSGYQRYQAKILFNIYTKSPKTVQKLIEATLDNTQDPSVHHSRSIIKKAKLFLESVRRESGSTKYVAPLMQSTSDYMSFSPDLIQNGHTPPEVGNISNSDDVMQMMYSDTLVYLPQDILAKVDRASMAFSLETRAPFLDTQLIELCFSLPRTWHRRGMSGKRILKESFYNYLSKDIWRRRKQGFAVPLACWFKGSLGQELRERLSTTSTLPFSSSHVGNLLETHNAGKADYSMLLWATYIYLIWREAL